MSGERDPLPLDVLTVEPAAAPEGAAARPAVEPPAPVTMKRKPRKRGKPSPGRPKGVQDKEVGRTRTPPTDGRGRIGWQRVARVVDIDAYTRIRASGVGAKKISKALGVVVSTAQALMDGRHWQQNPERVKEFNRYRGASVDVATGRPTVDDLIKFGSKQAMAASEGDKDLRKMVLHAGVAPGAVEETVRKLQMLLGAEADIPAVPDTQYFKEQFDRKLAIALACLDSTTIASMTGDGLGRLVNMLTTNRALMRGEPTAIVRNEHRGGLDDLAKMLAAELARRGSTVELPKGPGGYQEVEQ
jgi:hypothetical protein